MIKKQEQECKINFANHEGWRFIYGYESDGKDVYLDVIVVDEEDGIEFHLNGKSVGLATDDFKGCEDIDDCGLVIAKHLIKDNDGVVLATFVNRYYQTLTSIFYEKKLSKDLEYINRDLDNESWTVTLSANRTTSVHSYDYLDVSEDDVQKVFDMVNCRDSIGLQEYMFENDYNTNEVLNMWGDRVERLSFEVNDFKNNTLHSGEIVLSTNNLFEYDKFQYNQIVDKDNHPNYVLIHQDEMKRSYATFRVPQNFNIGEIHFVDRYIIPKNYMLDWDNFGDYMTTLDVFCYRGKLFYAEDYGDAGSWGCNYYGLFKWIAEKNRYELIAEMR